MNKFLDTIIHSYKKPEVAFHFCGSETINYNILDVFNQKEENWKMLFTRSLLKRDKFVVFLKRFNIFKILKLILLRNTINVKIDNI